MATFRTAVLWLLCFAVPMAGQEQKPSAPETLPAIASKVEKLQKIDGYMPLYWQASAGKLFVEIGRFDQEMLYQVSLPAGLASNPVGLDRGQLGDSSVVTFERIGPKVLMTQPNYAAISEAVKPIVYYVDNGAPEPIRSALVEGASWWNQAFEAAGFRNAFQVKVLPADADPTGVRYRKADPLPTPPGEPIGGRGGR